MSDLECSDLSELCGRDLSRRLHSNTCFTSTVFFVPKTAFAIEATSRRFRRAVTSHRTPNHRPRYFAVASERECTCSF